MPFTGLEQSIIIDDLMSTSSASVSMDFLNNNDRTILMKKSSYLHLDVKISNVDALPIFFDSDSTSLGNYYSTSPDVLHSYCRNAVPDSLILRHRLLKDKRTRVGRIRCSRRQKDLCPDDVSFGEYYAQRLQLPCDAAGNPKSDNQWLYCSDYVQLLSMFGVPRSMFLEGPTWNFIEARCKYLYSACHTCKEEKCKGKHNALPCIKQCDYICLKYRDSRCDRSLVSCSRGDFSEWNIRKEFKETNSRKRFNCYIKRKLPDQIFQISYRVTIPNSDLKSSWIRVVSRQSTRGHKMELGDFEAEYDVTTLLPEHVIVSGQRKTDGGQYELEAHVLEDIPSSNFDNVKDGLRFMPSDPSVIAFHHWSDESHCKVLSNWQKYMKIAGPKRHDVNVEKIGSVHGRFAYRVTQTSNPLRVNISFRNSVSVLAKLAKRSRLTTLSSNLGGNQSHWQMNVTGNITDCPAFVQLSILEKTTMLLLLKQDMLVRCPLNYFRVMASVPKTRFAPFYKARLFIAYVNDGVHTYETRMEKRKEVYVPDAFVISSKQATKSGELFDFKVLAKFDAVSILTGCFIFGLIAIVIFSCIFRPSKRKKAHVMGYRQAAIHLGRRDIVNKELGDEDKLKSIQLVPIVFLVVMRVAYSFVLTISFIIILFNVVNKHDMKVLEDFDAFVKLKINQSNQIALALDQFRESEVKIMTDKAAFLECACDYNIARIMRNMKENMTALVQLNDLIAFDKISEILLQALLRRFHVLAVIDGKIRYYEDTIRNKLTEIEGRLTRYAYRIYGNKWFEVARASFGVWDDLRGVDFLGHIGSIDTAMFRRIKSRMLSALLTVRSKLSLSNVIKRLRIPLYPLTNVLLTPIRSIKRRVKEAVRQRLNQLKNMILRKIPCLGDIDMKKWERTDDEDNEFDKESNKRCRQQTANKFIKDAVDVAKKAKSDSNDFVIRSVKDDAALNVLEGDATEEQYEEVQETKLKGLKRVAAFYTQNEDVKAALNLLRKHSVIIIIVFDVLLITYRNLKTYRFAYMMAAGYEVIKEHQRAEGGQVPQKPAGKRMIDLAVKPILMFFNTFSFILKFIFSTLVIPFIVFIAGVLVLFYLGMSFAYNGLNVDTLDQLGAFKLLSARLDLNFNLTSESLKEQANRLNKFDLGMYKESLRVQTEELRNTAKQFNADEIVRMKRIEAELCDIDKERGCTINFRNLMHRLEMNVEPCVFPVIKARMPDNVYDSAAYRRQLKYELKRYVVALRRTIIRTFYIILGVIGTIVFTVVMSKVIFKFLKSMGMIRIRSKHIYYEIPNNIKNRFYVKLK